MAEHISLSKFRKKRGVLYLTALILAAVFLWGIFFTGGLPFFWEDFGSYSIVGAKNPYTLSTISKSLIKEFFATERFFRIGFAVIFSDRPYQYLTNSFQGILFGNQVLFYRMFKSLFLAMIACLIFAIISRVSILFALLGVALYIVSSEVWAILASSMDVAIYSQFTTLLSIVIFLKLFESKERGKIFLWLHYIAILVISQYSVLSKNDGRYLAIIFFVTLFFFQRNRLSLHLPMLFMLFTFEIPLLGYLRNVFTGSKTPVINFGSHNSPVLTSTLKNALKNYIFPLNAVGKMLTIIFISAMVIHLFCWALCRKKQRQKLPVEPLLQWRSFLFLLWFMCAFIMIAISRNFNYEGLADISVGECSYFVLPFVIFLCSYLCLLGSYFPKGYRYVFIILCAVLISAEVFIFKLPRLNRFRGGWGNYFCSWDNAKKYINKTTDGSLVLAIVQMRYPPFIFWESSNEVIPNISVTRSDFSKIVEDEDGIFTSLIKNGYIDEEGIIQNKFRVLDDESKMILPINQAEKRKEVFRILSTGFILPAESCPFYDLVYIENKFKKGGFNDIFVVSRETVDFRKRSKRVVLKDETIVDGDSGDLYDRFKRLIGKSSRPLIHIYHFKLQMPTEAITK